MREAESLLAICKVLGYADEKAMFKDLYSAQNLSIQDIAKRLGFSTGLVSRRLKAAEVKMRSRGGPNRVVDSKLHHVPDAEFADIHGLAEKLAMHHSTIYKEAKRRGLCISALSPQLKSSTATRVEASTTSSSPKLPERTELTLSGIEEELLRETSSSSTTEPTKELPSMQKNTSALQTNFDLQL